MSTNNGIIITGRFKVALLAVVVAASSMFAVQYQSQAAPFWVLVARLGNISSIGGILWVIYELYTPDDHTGQANARPSVGTTISSYSSSSVYSGDASGFINGISFDIGNYEYYDYTYGRVELVNDYDYFTGGDEVYELVSTERISGPDFISASQFDSVISAEKGLDENGWPIFTSAGFWIVSGQSKRYTHESTIPVNSVVTGSLGGADPELLQKASESNMTYEVGFSWSRKQMRWDGANHCWEATPWNNHSKSERLSATSNTTWHVSAVTPNCKVSVTNPSGGSNITWKEEVIYGATTVDKVWYDENGNRTGEVGQEKLPSKTIYWVPQQSTF